MANLRAIQNHVIFQFEDETTRKDNFGKSLGQFCETTDWGFEVSIYDESAKKPRWATVISAGPKAYGVTENMRVLVESLKWTSSVKFQGELYWRTDMENILAVENIKQPSLTPF